MKFKLLMAAMLSLVISSCQKNDDSNEVISQRFVHKYGFDVSEKEWLARNQNGKVITELKNGIVQTSNFVSGKLHGETTFSFPKSNIIQEKCIYDEGNLVKQTFYEISGLPIKEFSHDLDGKKIITIWNSTGVPISMEEYDGALLVSARYYNPKNEIEATIIDGQGTRIKRDKQGVVVSKEKVVDGQIASRTTFHPNGEIQSQCSFKNYKLDGVQETFSPSKKLITRAFWKDGKLDGTIVCYRNGTLFQEVPYLEGKKHGLEKEYHLDGTLAKEIHWENDQRHGSSRYYYDDYTDIQWYFRNMAVDLKKFQMLEFRDELMAEINGDNNPLQDDSSLESTYIE